VIGVNPKLDHPIEDQLLGLIRFHKVCALFCSHHRARWSWHTATRHLGTFQLAEVGNNRRKLGNSQPALTASAPFRTNAHSGHARAAGRPAARPPDSRARARWHQAALLVLLAARTRSRRAGAEGHRLR